MKKGLRPCPMVEAGRHVEAHGGVLARARLRPCHAIGARQLRLLLPETPCEPAGDHPRGTLASGLVDRRGSVRQAHVPDRGSRSKR